MLSKTLLGVNIEHCYGITWVVVSTGRMPAISQALFFFITAFCMTCRALGKKRSRNEQQNEVICTRWPSNNSIPYYVQLLSSGISYSFDFTHSPKFPAPSRFPGPS